MNRTIIAAIAVIIAIPASAQQVVRESRPGDIAVITRGERGICGPPERGGRRCVNPLVGIPRDTFAFRHEIDEVASGAAVAAAMQDAIPNKGDRFAIRFGAAGYGDEFAGAVGFSVNIHERARLSLNYGQGEKIGIVSGGLNLSFE